MGDNQSCPTITDAMRRAGAAEIAMTCETGRMFPKEVEEIAEEVFRLMWEAGARERSAQAAPG